MKLQNGCRLISRVPLSMILMKRVILQMSISTLVDLKVVRDLFYSRD
jgi:hypothetical protein